MSLVEQERLVNDLNDASHGVMPDGHTTLCGIDTRDKDYSKEWGEWGDMSCGRCQRRLEAGARKLLRDFGIAA